MFFSTRMFCHSNRNVTRREMTIRWNFSYSYWNMMLFESFMPKKDDIIFQSCWSFSSKEESFFSENNCFLAFGSMSLHSTFCLYREAHLCCIPGKQKCSSNVSIKRGQLASCGWSCFSTKVPDEKTWCVTGSKNKIGIFLFCWAPEIDFLTYKAIFKTVIVQTNVVIRFFFMVVVFLFSSVLFFLLLFLLFLFSSFSSSLLLKFYFISVPPSHWLGIGFWRLLKALRCALIIQRPQMHIATIECDKHERKSWWNDRVRTGDGQSWCRSVLQGHKWKPVSVCTAWVPLHPHLGNVLGHQRRQLYDVLHFVKTMRTVKKEC